MNEGEYLEMVNQLKEKYDEIEEKMATVARLETVIKKDLITAYGVVRLVDHLLDTNPIGYDNEMVVLIEMLRGVLSDSVDKHIIN